MKIMKRITTSLVMVIVFFLNYSYGQNLVPNKGFRNLDASIPNPKGYCWNKGTPGSGFNPAGMPYVGGDAKAVQPAGWWIWLNGTLADFNNLCVITETLPFGSNCIPWPDSNDGVTDNIKSDKMVHLKMSKPDGGLVTTLTLPAKSSKQVYSCWVYVIKGKAKLTTMHDPNSATLQSAQSTTTCKWEKISLVRNDNQGNEITIYSADADAEFYVCNVRADF
jgi:hypothetical protein